jgi:catechol 2,3-dioxygenase-like lactoylglutathione lyase family enzyme
MYLSHISLTMPKGGEQRARAFYTGCLGIREIPKPERSPILEEVWFEAGGVELHLSVEEPRNGADRERHFGLGCGDVEGLKARLKVAGVQIEDGPSVPCKHFFIHDPFGNRIEIHAPKRWTEQMYE